MHTNRHSTNRNFSDRAITAVAVVFLFGGTALVGAAIASQRNAPEPPGLVEAPGPSSNATIAATRWSTTGSPEVVGETLSRSKPVILNIPSIEVHSEVQHLGRTPDGALETPAPGPDYNKAAWYRHSPTPGSLGPAVLLGHVDSAIDGPSVFFRLGELEAGDRISITRADDSTAVFVVDEIHSYAKDDFPTEVVYSDIDHAGLRILTCGGAFDDTTGHYLDNIVVFASLVGPPELERPYRSL